MTWESIEQEYEEILAMARNVAPEYVATVRTFRGMVLSYRDEWDRAQDDLEYGFECAKKAGNLGLVFLAGTTLLIIDYGKGRLDILPKRVEELTSYITELDDAHYESIFRRTEAYLELAQGNFDRAEAAARKGRSVSSFVRHPVHEVEVRLILCRALLNQGNVIEAKEVFEEIFPDIDSCLRRVKVVALVCLAELKELNGDSVQARLLCSVAKEYRDHLGLRMVIFESEYLSDKFDSIGTDPVDLVVNDELVDNALKAHPK
jgi:tetratricopeptide (TPR) repeat protein